MERAVRRSQGFSLLELVVVLVLLGVLIAVAATTVPGLLERGRVKGTAALMAGVRETLYREAEARGVPSLSQLWTQLGLPRPYTYPAKPPLGERVLVDWTDCGGEECLVVTVTGIPNGDLASRVGAEAVRRGEASACTAGSDNVTCTLRP